MEPFRGGARGISFTALGRGTRFTDDGLGDVFGDGLAMALEVGGAKRRCLGGGVAGGCAFGGGGGYEGGVGSRGCACW